MFKGIQNAKGTISTSNLYLLTKHLILSMSILLISIGEGVRRHMAFHYLPTGLPLLSIKKSSVPAEEQLEIQDDFT